MKITILGTGTWGLALADLLSRNGHKVIAYTRFEEEKEKLESTYAHPRFAGITLDRNIVFSDVLEASLQDAEAVLFASPSLYIRDVARQANPYLTDKTKFLISVAKGLEDDTFLTMSEVIEEETKHRYPVVALTGPTHAEEVVKGLPTLCLAASKDIEAAKQTRDAFSTSYFRVYDSNDIYGAELCGALKNVIALGAGIIEGLGYGDNAKAALITRGLVEIIRLGTALGAEKKTFYGLAGIGDLIVTATSKHSRNRECGIYLGQGYRPDEAKAKVGMVVEGLNALEAAYHLANKKDIEMPIVSAVYKIVNEGYEPKKAVEELFARSLKTED